MRRTASTAENVTMRSPGGITSRRFISFKNGEKMGATSLAKSQIRCFLESSRFIGIRFRRFVETFVIENICKVIMKKNVKFYFSSR